LGCGHSLKSNNKKEHYQVLRPRDKHGFQSGGGGHGGVNGGGHGGVNNGDHGGVGNSGGLRSAAAARTAAAAAAAAAAGLSGRRADLA